MHRLAILRTAIGAYAFVWQERRDFLSLAFPAIAVLAIVFTLFAWFFWPESAMFVTEEPVSLRPSALPAGFVLGVIYLVVWVMFAVAWHRRYLMPHEVSTVAAALRWRRRQTRFLILAIGLFLLSGLTWVLGISVVTFLFVAVVSPLRGGGDAVVAIWTLVIFLALLLVAIALALTYARLVMLFPSTAVDHRMSLRECWTFTRGNAWRLLLIIVVAAVPIFVVTLPIEFGISSIVLALKGNLAARLIGTLVYMALTFFGIAVGVSVLSIAYRELMAARPGQPAAGA